MCGINLYTKNIILHVFPYCSIMGLVFDITHDFIVELMRTNDLSVVDRVIKLI